MRGSGLSRHRGTSPGAPDALGLVHLPLSIELFTNENKSIFLNRERLFCFILPWLTRKPEQPPLCDHNSLFPPTWPFKLSAQRYLFHLRPAGPGGSDEASLASTFASAPRRYWELVASLAGFPYTKRAGCQPRESQDKALGAPEVRSGLPPSWARRKGGPTSWAGGAPHPSARRLGSTLCRVWARTSASAGTGAGRAPGLRPGPRGGGRCRSGRC